MLFDGAVYNLKLMTVRILKQTAALAGSYGGGLSGECGEHRRRGGGVAYSHFAHADGVNAVLGAFIRHFKSHADSLLRLFPCPVNTVSLGSVGAPQMFSFSAPAAFAMLLSGAMLILELDTNEKKC